jgi:hypothetical protein
MLESSVKSKTVAFAKSRGWQHHALSPTGRRGEADSLFTKFPAQSIFIEFKRDDEDAVPRKNQLRAHNKIREQGFEVFVVNYVEEGYEIFDAR